MADFTKMMGVLLLATSLCAGLMAFGRNESVSTESKVIMHPWSVTDLVEVSLTSGKVTIGVVDILLVYVYHILLIIDAVVALSGTVLLSESVVCLRNDALLYWTLSAACTSVLVGVAAFLVVIFANMPYDVSEYTKIYMSNLNNTFTLAGNHLLAKVTKRGG